MTAISPNAAPDTATGAMRDPFERPSADRRRDADGFARMMHQAYAVYEALRAGQIRVQLNIIRSP